MDQAATRITDLINAAALDVGFAAIHAETGQQIAVNGAELFPTASTFKVPVMVEIYAQARQGKFKISDGR